MQFTQPAMQMKEIALEDGLSQSGVQSDLQKQCLSFPVCSSVHVWLGGCGLDPQRKLHQTWLQYRRKLHLREITCHEVTCIRRNVGRVLGSNVSVETGTVRNESGTN